MDPAKNPFSPGAGTQPPELAGRDAIIEAATLALERIRRGRPEKSQMLLGLRGVGKTVLLNRIGTLSEEAGFLVAQVEAPEGKRLAVFLAPALKAVLIKLSRKAQAKDLADRGLATLRAFASAFKVSIGEVEVSVSNEGVAESGNLEIDLPELLLTVGAAAKAAATGVAICIDEVQYLVEEDLRGLIVAMHRIAQKGYPVVMFGAGLPQIAALAGEAKSYAERLFDYPEVGALETKAAMSAVRGPIIEEGASIDDAALREIVDVTKGYPYFLQEWGKHAWNTAQGPGITRADVSEASAKALAALDKSFFRVRFDRLTPREQDYLRAMAALGSGPHRSGAIAEKLNSTVESMGPLRGGLIKKGMIWSPAHGDTAFTVPMFDDYMKRAMPGWTPPSKAQRAKHREKTP